MSVITSVKKTGNNVTSLFSRPAFDTTEVPTPLFAVVGVADLAFGQVKDVPADVTAEAKRVQALIAEASKTVPAQVMALPTQAKKVRSTVENQLDAASVKATSFYSKLAVRGEHLIAQIRRQPSTEAAVAEGKAAVRKVEAAVKNVEAAGVAAKKSVKASAKVVQDSATVVA